MATTKTKVKTVRSLQELELPKMEEAQKTTVVEQSAEPNKKATKKASVVEQAPKVEKPKEVELAIPDGFVKVTYQFSNGTKAEALYDLEEIKTADEAVKELHKQRTAASRASEEDKKLSMEIHRLVLALNK